MEEEIRKRKEEFLKNCEEKEPNYLVVSPYMEKKLTMEEEKKYD